MRHLPWLLAAALLVGCKRDEPKDTDTPDDTGTPPVDTCGDGLVGPSEMCDDGGEAPGDGCSADCDIEEGYACSGAEPSVCTPVCGDGLILGDEACDDENTSPGDGCDGGCDLEAGFDCVDEPSRCCPLDCSPDGVAVLGCDQQTIEVCEAPDVCADGACARDACAAAAIQGTSVGCDFWTFRPSSFSDADGACFVASVVNTSDLPAHLEVSYAGQALDVGTFAYQPQGQGLLLTYQPYDPVAGLPPGEMALLFLTDDASPGGLLPNCPVPPAVQPQAGFDGTGLGEAFHLTSDEPITAVSIWPYGGGAAAIPSASLLLPTSTWDTDYVALDAYPSQIVANAATIDVVAQQDGTAITLLPTAPIAGGPGVSPAPAGVPVTYPLNAGERLQLAQNDSLLGTAITATAPIGVWGGSACMNIPTFAFACDGASQQLPPIAAIGHTYLGARPPNRAGAWGDETVPWRLVGLADGTTLQWRPMVPSGAPTTLGRGEVVEFFDAGPFEVSSQDPDHPFHLSQYMTGSSTVASDAGDPEWLSVLPVDQYVTEAWFPTDPLFPETSLVVTRAPTPSGFEPVELDCLGPLTDWETVGDHEVTRVQLVVGDFQNVGSCTTGPQHLTSDGPFSVAAWGWGGQSALQSGFVSYAYQGAVSVTPLHGVVLPAQ